jgi:glycerophosphoryl diester phosphodiesterase
MTSPLIIAHRGYSSQALENSLEAFHLALTVPVDMIEFDIRMSADRVLYVMHDNQTGRTADRDVDIERLSSKDLAGVRLRNGERIPLLEDVLALTSGKAGVNIEIKSSGAGAVLARCLSRSPYRGALMISSFREPEVLAVSSVLPALQFALIYDTFSPRLIPDYRRKGYSTISLRKNAVTESLAKACHDQGLLIFVWTVDQEDEMKRCIDWEIDGIYTNNPGLLKQLLGKGRASGF